MINLLFTFKVTYPGSHLHRVMLDRILRFVSVHREKGIPMSSQWSGVCISLTKLFGFVQINEYQLKRFCGRRSLNCGFALTLSARSFFCSGSFHFSQSSIFENRDEYMKIELIKEVLFWGWDEMNFFDKIGWVLQ